MASSSKTPKKKTKKAPKVREGRMYIHSSYNNTLITVTDANGNALLQSSAGRVGFGGTRKSTPFAAQQVMADIAERLKPFAMEEVKVFVKGVGNARETAVRSLSATGLSVSAIRDITPIPHNGVRARKRRRV